MLAQTVFQSEDASAADGFDSWCEHLSRGFAPVEVTTDQTASFQASQRVLDLGPVRLWTINIQPMTIRRTPWLIRQSDPEIYHLSLPLHGALAVSQGEHEAACRADNLVLQHSSHPYTTRAIAAPAQGQQRILGAGAAVPRDVLPLSADRVNGLMGQRIPAHEGIGSLLAGFINNLTSDADPYQPADGPRQGIVVIDLLSALLAQVLDIQDTIPPESRQRTLFLRIQNFIRHHLADPHLDPDAIAAAHHISVRHLHRLFQQRDLKVSAWITQQRLERARQYLADPSLLSVPVHVIAHWCGFTHPSHFSRTFRNTYGVTPGEHRNSTPDTRA
ncbi:AraC family transcriptional regulator [Streptomyces sp. NPDC059863]|uniref:AraC family transcriptional regulator n=1 Tax=unclassified Streptomyces TaxID=2593676 RepID=UPI00364A4520